MSETERIDTLKALQKRIREATGPDAELDFEIARTFFPRTWPHKEWPLHFYINNGWRTPDLYTTYPDGLGACVGLFHKVLPGYAWKVGTCCVSDDAWVVPDFNCPVHGDRLREKFGEIEHGSIWDTGIDIDRRPPGNVCLTFLDAIISATISELEARQQETVG